MTGATHFIEVWKGFSGKTYSTVNPICRLGNELTFSRELGFKVIAIWYIKPKQRILAALRDIKEKQSKN